MIFHTRVFSFVLSLVLVALFVSSCSAPQATPVSTQPPPLPAPTRTPAPAPTDSASQVIMIDAADFTYSTSSPVAAGWVDVTLTNSGAEPHHVQFMRLNDGVTLDQFQEALKQGEGPAMALVRQMGGVGAIAPGGSAQATLNLPAGEYVILCFVPSPSDQVPHFAKGMIRGLTVQAAGDSQAAEPTASLSVALKDFSFDMPQALPSGKTVIKVTNDGPEPHEFNLLRLAEGKTSDDVFKFLAAPDGPPPFTPVGGMNGLDIGLSGYIEFDFEPGNYVAICNIPSPKAEGHPHFTLGMIKQFAVAEPATTQFPTGKFVTVKDKGVGYQFNTDGSFGFYFAANDPVLTGEYTVVGDLLSLTSPGETDAKCMGWATYQWVFDGEQLTFAPVSQDTCRGRRESFAETYVKGQ